MRFDLRPNDWPASHPDGDPEGGAPVLRMCRPCFFPFSFLPFFPFNPEICRMGWRILLASPMSIWPNA
jgi:hypothetical protein